MNLFIGIEGHSFSGKTTLLKDLSATGAINVVDEHDVFANGAENFPDIKFKNEKDVINDIKFFLDLEEKRCQKAIELIEENGKPTIFDRTIISVVLFQKYLKDQKKSWLHGYEDSIRIYQDAITTGRIFIPSRLIHLKPENKSVFQERTKRAVSIDFYKKFSTNEYMNKHYEYILENLFDEGSYTTLYSDNTKRSRQKLVEKSLDFIFNSDKYTDTTKTLKNLSFNF